MSGSTPPPVGTSPRRLRGRTLERASAVVLGLGLAMLMQPWSMTLFTYSFTVVLVGVVLFSIAVKLPQD
jgi:hypothetical protein